MKACSICGLEYQPVTGEEHNGIHDRRSPRELIGQGNVDNTNALAGDGDWPFFPFTNDHR